MDYSQYSKEELISALTEARRLLKECRYNPMRDIYTETIERIENAIKELRNKNPIKG